MHIRTLIACLAAALIGSPASAQEKKAPLQPQGSVKKGAEDKKAPAAHGAHGNMENQHALCIGCHGLPGYKTAFPEVYHVPKIAGQQAAYLVSALKAYKTGARSHPSMRGIAASLTDEQMEELAAYYAGTAK
jgi:cytochrome c553